MPNENLPIEGHQLPALEMGAVAVPAIVMSAGECGAYRFLEFFAANIRNLNTRSAYYRNVCAFFTWCERRHVREPAIPALSA